MILASTAFAASLSLSYDEALGLAEARNPSILGAVEDVRAADGAVTAARSTFSPSFTLDGNGYGTIARSGSQFGLLDSDSTGWSWGAGLSQTLSTGTNLSVNLQNDFSRYNYTVQGFEVDGKGWSTGLTFTLTQSLLQGTRLRYNLQAVRAAVRAKSAAEAARQAARQEALAAVATAYWSAWAAVRLVGVAEQTVALAGEQARVVDALVGAGKLAPVESTRIAAAQAEAERALLSARSGAETAKDGLLVLLGEAPGSALELRSTPVAPSLAEVDADAVVESVLQGNPELIALRLSWQNAEAAEKNAKHALLPSLTASASYGLSGYQESLADSYAELFEGELPTWGVGAQLDLPIFNLADRGALAQAQAEATKAKLAVEAMEASLAAEARQKLRALQDARRAVELVQLQVRLAEQTLAAEQARLAEGRALQKDVIQAIKDLDQARVEAEKTLADVQTALVEIDRLKGVL